MQIGTGMVYMFTNLATNDGGLAVTLRGLWGAI